METAFRTLVAKITDIAMSAGEVEQLKSKKVVAAIVDHPKPKDIPQVRRRLRIWAVFLKEHLPSR